MNLTPRSPKHKAVDSPRVTFKQEEDSNDEAQPLLCTSKKFKVGKPYKSGMEWDENWSKATKKSYAKAYNKFSKKNPRSKEAKKKEQRLKRRELYEKIKKQQKELDKQFAAINDDDE